jgi:outer membrane cobalamin receptor
VKKLQAVKIFHAFQFAVILLGAFLVLPIVAHSQNVTPIDSAAIDTMSLESLLNVKESGVSSELEAVINSRMDVASRKSVGQRKSPGIVTLITQEEIDKSGARDLIDVLRLVPGIDFGVDVQGVVSIGMRGDWAHEGKVLLLLDGQEMNEILYSTIQLGNHFDVSQIKRIEIIRGPGSAIYGGFAEYLVISIITKNGEDLKGITASATYAQTQKALGYRDVSLSIGQKIKDFSFSLAGFIGQGNRSDGVYNDFSGNSYNMAGNANINPENINLGISYKGLSFRGIYDNYQMTTRDNYGPAMSAAYPCNFLSEFLELKYDAKIGDKITITPLFNFKRQQPWNFSGTVAAPDSSYTIYDKTAERFRGSLTMSYDITKKINLIAGGEIYYDYAFLSIDTTPFINGQNHISYTNRALYVQGLFRSRFVNVILGARYDNNSGYPQSFVPRVGLTKKINNLSFKLLYNNSFRSPGIEDIDLSANGSLKPEMTQVLEFEAGYEITREMYLTLNLYDITTKDPIVYAVIDNNTEAYQNLNQQGSRGAELDYRIKSIWGYVDFNYSFYTIVGKTTVPNFQVPVDNSMTLGFAANKFNLYGCYNLTRKISIAPTISYIGKRYGYAPVDSGGSYLKTFSPTVLANIFISFSDCLTKGLKVGIGCYNIFNSDYTFIQPYYAGHAPLPSTSREYALRLTYDFNFKK